MAMDRRDALKLLTGGAAVAVGASMIESSTAFADGGTLAFRPTCLTTSAVNWSSAAVNNRLQVTVVHSATSCTSGWTGSFTVALRVTSGFEVRSGPNTTQIATGGNWSAFQTIAANTTYQINQGSNTDITDLSSITVDVMIRRVCTNNTNSARKAYCCTSYTKTAVYARGGTDEWPAGSSTGNLGTGLTPVASGAGCTAP